MSQLFFWKYTHCIEEEKGYQMHYDTWSECIWIANYDPKRPKKDAQKMHGESIRPAPVTANFKPSYLRQTPGLFENPS